MSTRREQPGTGDPGPGRTDGEEAVEARFSGGGASATERALRARVAELEERLALAEAILENLPDPVFVKDEHHRFIYVNEATEAFVKHPRDRMLGRTDADFFPPDQCEGYWRQDDGVLESGVLDEHLEELVDGDDVLHMISTRKARGAHPAGGPMLVGTIRDVTEAKARMDRSDAVLRAVRQLLERVAQEARIGIALFGPDGTFQLASGPDLARMGVSTERVLGVHYTGLGALWPELVEHVGAALRGVRHAGVFQWRGKPRHVTIAPVYDDEGQVSGATIFSLDLSEAQERDRRQARVERMDSLGRLAGGVAHDLNNLLAIVMMGTSSLAEAIEAGELEGARSQIRLLERSVDRGSRLSRQLVSFARRQVGPPTVVELHAHLRPAEVFLDNLVGSDVRLRFSLCEESPRVRLLPGQVEQLVINLVTHAAAGLPEGGHVSVETRCLHIGEDGEELPPGDYVVLRVIDDGQPLEPEVRERLFEPFFDPHGRGAGMSMATCYGITVQARGVIRASVDDQGRNVTEAFLPRTTDEPTAQPLRVPPRTGSHRVGRILLAEDEPALREQVEQLLRTVGHEVVAVADGQEAIEMLAAAPGDFDLVLTDVLMPRKSGVELVRSLSPDLPAILMSGFVADSASAVAALAAEHTVLVKPVRPDLLLRAVQEALARNG